MGLIISTLPWGWCHQLLGQYLSFSPVNTGSWKLVMGLLVWANQMKDDFWQLQSLGTGSIAVVGSCDLSSAIWLQIWGTDVAER